MLLCPQKLLIHVLLDPHHIGFGAVVLFTKWTRFYSEIRLVGCGGNMIDDYGSRHELHGHESNNQTIQHVGTSTAACLEEA